MVDQPLRPVYGTVAELTPSPRTNRELYLITDAAGFGDVSTGAGSIRGLAYWNGSAWKWLTALTVDTSGNLDGGVNEISLTLVSDEVSLPTHTRPSVWSVRLDTEGGAASDNCQSINGLVQGDVVIVGTTIGTRDVVLKHSTGGGTLRHQNFGSGDQTLGEIFHRAVYTARTGLILDLTTLAN